MLKTHAILLGEQKIRQSASAEDRNSTTTMVKLMGTRNKIRNEPGRTIYLSHLFGRADGGRPPSGGDRRTPRMWTQPIAEFGARGGAG